MNATLVEQRIDQIHLVPDTNGVSFVGSLVIDIMKSIENAEFWAMGLETQTFPRHVE